ncbi:hypothetical protein EV641_11261 [Rhodococcus sp. SMB37]|uniref:leucine-rich repeat domain-containing protein n=1 Tax=Rhodococcus sp. SMB37 TaxID=2512213 RepID=UPI00104BCFA5|nr:leucine-rich repeat domain-containing protein [Rhodococcus sp. SMB37]TCN50409.1 hypothetical protein EV641_11261 [Rhodococcus sp. SMB37]
MTISTPTSTFAGLPVQQYTTGSDTPPDPAATAWKIATDWERGDDGFVDDLLSLAGQPWAGQITTLVFGCWTEASDPLPADTVVPLLAAFPAVRHLFVGDMTFEESEISWIDWGDLGAVLDVFPRLETLQLRGGSSTTINEPVPFTAPALPLLRSLTVESGGLQQTYLEALLAIDAPELTDLELWLGVDNYGAITDLEPLADLLAGNRFPAMTHLGLRNSDLADRIAAALAQAPVLQRITTLDLSNGTLTDTGADALAAAGLGAVRTLILDHHFVSDETLTRLRAAHPHIEISAADRQEPETYNDEVYLYTAVSE